jgi:uncharacterized protein (DUF302 family)
LDQAAEAQAVGIAMRPMELLIFGDPKTGSPLMIDYPSLAIDLPLKALAWESKEKKVFLSFNSTAYLVERHRLSGGKSMRKVNTNTLPEFSWSSPKGKFCGTEKRSLKHSGATRARPI